MSYIGAQTQNLVSPQFVREVITGDGSATSFTLINDVPGFNADNVTVVVNNVVQEPGAAYTIGEDANGNPRLLDFGSGNVLATTDSCYLIHKGIGTLNITPAAGSVNSAALQDNLKSNTVDSFTGVGSVSGGNASFTLSEAPLNASSITVYVNGIFQKPTTNYSVSGTTLTFVGLTVATDDIDVHHHTVRSTVSHVADASVTSAKLDTNIAVGGTLEVTGASTLTGAQTLTGNTTLSGTLTGGASTDIAINTNKFTVAAASGNTVIAGTSTLTGASTHTGGLLTDTIGERTSTTGVTIDSLKIKDGAHHLPSAATGIFRSDGSTAVLAEASNVATLDNVTLGSSIIGLKIVQVKIAEFNVQSGQAGTGWGATSHKLEITGTSASNKMLLWWSGEAMPQIEPGYLDFSDGTDHNLSGYANGIARMGDFGMANYKLPISIMMTVTASTSLKDYGVSAKSTYASPAKWMYIGGGTTNRSTLVVIEFVPTT